jgi:hypothetical protein
MPTACLPCFSRRRSCSPKLDEGTTSSCSTRIPVAEFSDAISEPETDDNSRYQARVDYFKDLCNDPSFIQESRDSDEIVLSYKPRKNSEPLIARGSLFIPDWTPPDLHQVSKLILDTSNRHIWDSDLNSIETLDHQSVSDTDSLLRVWASFKGRYGFHGRDFFWDTFATVSETELIHVTVSGEDDGIERYPGRFTRGRTVLGGLCIRRTSTGTEMILINQTDVGSRRANFVPEWIVDSVMKKSPLKLISIKNFIIDFTS